MTRPLLSAAVLAAGALVACETTVDPDIASQVSTGSTTTTVFVTTGSTEELLDQLLDEVRELSEAIVDNEGQHEAIDRIDVIWEAARPGVEELVPDSMLEFDRMMVMLHTAVDRRRPADADKAYTNLLNLVAALRG